MIELNNLTTAGMRRLAAVVLIGCLVILFLSGFETVKAKVNDIKRRADIKTMVQALDLYHDKYGKYPDSAADWQGWDLSIGYQGSKPEFIKELSDNNLIDRQLKDPINNESYHYRYEKFQAGDYGCANSFYILQVINFELPTRDIGRGDCPELNWATLTPNGYTVQGFD